MTVDYVYLDALGAHQIFFPRSDTTAAPAGASDIAIDVEPGVSIAARHYVHDPQAPAVLYFHGNGEVASDHDDIAPLYHAIGLNLFVAEFRGYGRSTGQPSFGTLVGDAIPVARAFHALLDEAKASPVRYLMGRSLGSHPALEIAARAPRGFNGLVIESGAAGVERLLRRLGAPETARAAELVRAHDDKLRSVALPTLIIHGAEDDLVPLAQAHHLAELLPSPPSLLVVEGAGHNDLLWRGSESYFGAIAELVAATAG